MRAVRNLMALLESMRDETGGGAFGDWMFEVFWAEGDCGCLVFFDW